MPIIDRGWLIGSSSLMKDRLNEEEDHSDRSDVIDNGDRIILEVSNDI